MKGLIVYESFFGNTEQVARAVGSGIGAGAEIEVMKIGDVKPEHLKGLGLLIVGSPTRQFRPTAGVKAFFEGLSGGALNGVKVAAFDTGIALSDMPSAILQFFYKIGIGRYAAPIVADLLKKYGGALVIPAEGFYVEKAEGPMKPGELERAAEWGKKIAASL